MHELEFVNAFREMEMDILIRNMKYSDLKHLIKIEKASFPDPLQEKEFEYLLRKKLTYCLVAEIDKRETKSKKALTAGRKQVVGYIIFNTESKRQINLISIAVTPECRRQKIGTNLVQGVFHKLVENRRKIGITISDQDLYAHLFFRSLKFKAINVLRDFFGSGHDGYEFVYKTSNPYGNNSNAQESCKGI